MVKKLKIDQYEQNASWITGQLDKTGKTTVALADYIGITAQAVTKWKSSGHISTRYILAARDFFGTGDLPAWLAAATVLPSTKGSGIVSDEENNICLIDQITMEQAIERLDEDVPDWNSKPVVNKSRLLIMAYNMLKK